MIFAERGTQEQTCVDGAKTKSDLESLTGNNIQRLVRVTAHKRLVPKTASEIAAPNNPMFVTIVMDLGLGSNPNLHRAQKRPIQSADRSMPTVGWRRPEFSRRTWFEADTETKRLEMMLENARTVRRSVDVNEQARERAKTTPLRNEAQLNYVSLPGSIVK